MSTINKIEDDLAYEFEAEEIPPSDIVAYNELRSAADLYRLYKENILEIKPDFQREVVWVASDQSRFIDSLMKQLPIPSMCFSLDFKSQQWEVIDGLQRMWTIIRFLSDGDWVISDLKDIDKRIAGEKVSDIKSKFPDLYRRLENFSLPITILRCDYSKKHHAEYIFMIFHRLNAGGMKLNNQEIRNAVYQGVFNNFLKECSRNEDWENVCGKKRIKRFVDIELLLRFFAFYDHANLYQGKLASFLNDYMQKNRNNHDSVIKNKEIFLRMLRLINDRFHDKKILTSASNTVLEGIMFGVAKNLNFLESHTKVRLDNCYKKLVESEPFSEGNIREGISRKEKVLSRLGISEYIFSGK